MIRLIICFLLFVGEGTVWAAIDAKQFDNPDQEEIYTSLISELRCLVCQNQTIADSNAELAKDLRRQVYEMVQQGKTRSQITKYMLDRYGDFVLYRPPFKLKTGLLWIGPFLFLLTGIIVLVMYTRHRKNQDIVEMTPEQQEKMRQLLEKEDES